jgi:hypothetical protein
MRASPIPLLLLLGATACPRAEVDPTDAPSPPGPSGATGLDTETSHTGQPDDLFATPPELRTPDALVGGAREVVVSARASVPLEVRWAGPAGERGVRWPAATDFRVPLVGLRPEAEYTVTLVLDPDGDADHRTLALTGDPLPVNLPELDVLTLVPGATAQGHTLFAATTPGVLAAWLLLLDPEGVPVWWAYSSTRLGDLRLTDQGTLLGLGDFDIVELDWLGVEQLHYTSQPLGTATPIDVALVHHEVHPLPDGHLLTLDQSPVAVDDLPAAYDDLGSGRSATVADNGVVELDPTGQVVRRVALAELLPTSRIGWNSLDPVPAVGGALDWVHANAVVPDADGGWVVSLRHQDAVVKIGADGELAWILGDPAGWPAPWSDALLSPVGEVVWPYHQHAPQLQQDADGLHVLLFDNVNDGHTPYTAAPAAQRPSRLVEYRVDEAAGTVEQLWAYELEPDGPLAAFALGDADRLDNGHVLGVWGMLSEEGGATNLDQGRGNLSARIAEIDPRSGDVLFDLRVGDTRSRVPEGWSVYRAERLPRLFPTATSESP